MKNIYLKKSILISVFFGLLLSTLSAQNASFYTNTTSGCDTLTVNFTNTSTLGLYNPAEVRFIWSYGDGQSDTSLNASHFYNQVGNYFVQLWMEDTNGFFISSNNAFITVKGVQFSNPFPGTYCPNQSINFQAFPNYSVDSVIWNFGDGNYGMDTENHMYSDTGTYQYTGIVYGECPTDTITNSLTIVNGPTPNFFISPTSYQVCFGDEVSFNSSNPSAGHMWYFSNGDSSMSPNPSVVMDSNDLEVILALTECGTTGYDTILVERKDNVMPNAWNYNVNPFSTCPQENISFQGNEPGSYIWNLDDGTVVTNNNFSYAYQDTGMYNVVFSVTNGCGNSDTANFTINIQYSPWNTPFTYYEFANVQNAWMVDTMRICPGESVGFNNSSWPNGTYSTNTWIFGDGQTSTDLEPTHTFDSVGTFAVHFVMTNNCGGTDTTTRFVVVDPSIMPNQNLGALPLSICPGENVFFFVDGNDEENLSYSIWFGDGDSLIDVPARDASLITDVTAIHTYSDTGMYTYTFTATNVCGNTQVVNGQIFSSDSNMMPMFLVFGPDSAQLCPGDAGEFFAAGGVSFDWNWNDGTPNDTIQNPQHAFDSLGLHQPEVTITNACGQDTTISLNVYVGSNNMPSSWFSLPNFNYCTDEVISLAPNNQINPGYEYKWTLDDGTIVYDPITEHSYTEGGSYNIKLKVTNGCGSSNSSNFINVVDISVNTAAVDVNPSNCDLNTGSITNIQVIDPAFNSPYSYEWSDANGVVVSNTSNVFNLGIGTYYLQVTSQSGCSSQSVGFNVPTISSPAIPGFIGDLTQCKNDSFMFEVLNDSGAVITWYNDAALTDSIYNDTIFTFVANASHNYYVTQTINGCEGFPVIIASVVYPTYNINNPQTICNNESYMVGGNTYHIAGTYVDSLTSSLGCDSVITTVLTVNPTYAINNPQTICSNESYMVGSSTYHIAGTYVDSLVSSLGCDSVITTILTVNPAHAMNNPQTICQGETYTVGSSTYATAGTYVDSFMTSLGCDSVITTVLTVNPTYTINNPQTICDNESYMVGSSTYHIAGTYVDSLTTGLGCDSVITTVLTVNPTYAINNPQTICDNESYMVGSSTYHIAGTYVDSLTTELGCDSVITTVLTVNPTYTINNPQTICDNESYMVGSSTYHIAGTYVDSLTSSLGCDSVITTVLTVNPTYAMNNPQTICGNESYSIGGHAYQIAGTYVDTLMSDLGCDSVITTVLTVNPSYTINNPQSICQGESYSFNGNIYSLAGTYADTFATVLGCDSIILTQLTVHPRPAVTNSQILCPGETYTINGNTYSTTGVYVDTMSTGFGCDSIVTTVLIIVPVNQVNNPQALCEGGSYTVNGNTYDVAGTYVDTLVSGYGCDSIVTTVITFVDIDTSVTVTTGTITSNQSTALYQWLDCDSASHPIAGETNIAYSPLEDGNYAVQLTVGGCVDTTACHFVETSITSIQENASQWMEVFPNPASDVLYIGLKNKAGSAFVTLTDLQGKIVYQNTHAEVEQIQISIREFSAGTYILGVKIAEETHQWNVVIQ